MSIVETQADPVLQAIRTRRSAGVMRAEVPPRELIEKVIKAGQWAPNHHLTEPWRFFVISGDARHALGAAMAQAIQEEGDTEALAATGDRAQALQKERQKPLRAPVIIVIAIEPSDDPRVVATEEMLAGGAAAQNMLLAAHSLGLAARWRTGAAAYAPALRTFLGLSPRAQIIAFLYIGYAAGDPPQVQRSSPDDVTIWLE